MDIETIVQNGVRIAVVRCDAPIMKDVTSALDFVMSVKVETGCERIAVNKESLVSDFFVLSTGLAGEILQKFTTYRIKFAIYGDLTQYTATSKPLRDFIYESNTGTDVFFTSTVEKAVIKLGRIV